MSLPSAPARAAPPPLSRERAGASFPVRELTHVFYGGADKVALRDRLRAIAEHDPVFSRDDQYFNDRETAFKRSLEKVHRIMQLRKTHALSDNDFLMLKSFFVGDFVMPTSMHDQLFVPSIVGQMSDEQQAKWLKKAQDYNILGCYAQTELGHGSNIRALETTATFIPETDQFEVHSPTLTSTKWWPGSLGLTANHAIVFARLLLPDRDYGVHPFMVPIRSLEDHTPLKGIVVGEIGPKFGGNTNDNGFLRLDRVRIPRENMFMRYANVSREGRYSTPPHAKLSYGTMVLGRAQVVQNAAFSLSLSTTIAVRYSAVRTQGYKGTTAEETAIIDYRMQQYRLFPLVASVYAIAFTAQALMALYETMTSSLAGTGDTSLLAEVHASSSGIKVLATNIAAAGNEECRRACGGHGYSVLSGLPSVTADFAQSVTIEGDNYLLPQQTTRYLLKQYEAASKGKPVPPNVNYLANIGGSGETFAPLDAAAVRSPSALIHAYQHRALALVHHTAMAIGADVAAGHTSDAAWNNALVEVTRTSNAHCLLIVVGNFYKAIEAIKANTTTNNNNGTQSLVPVLERLAALFALYHIEQGLAEFLEDGYMNQAQAQLVRKEVRVLLTELRPDMVPLVDAFGLSDFQLNSAIGGYDGHVYETLYEWAQRSPLNKKKVVSGYEEYLKPIIHSKL